eukprot:GCRY01001544.1.p1 GENE.GCRY01001544.1~~GCRY01001544.1.p1  ORF type:complete len:267 (+),score=35.99 GCRY01001544.1:53-802(+)
MKASEPFIFALIITFCINDGSSAISVSKNNDVHLNEIVFSDGTSISTGQIAVYGSKNNPAKNCKEACDNNLPSSLFYLKTVSGSSVLAYCDCFTDEGGWLLASKFAQKDSFAGSISELDYRYSLMNGQWIQGINVTAPLNYDFTATATHGMVESVNWGDFLEKGKEYQLRQRVSYENGDYAFDVGFTFVYPGFLLQDHAPSPEEGIWTLSNRQGAMAIRFLCVRVRPAPAPTAWTCVRGDLEPPGLSTP